VSTPDGTSIGRRSRRTTAHQAEWNAAHADEADEGGNNEHKKPSPNTGGSEITRHQRTELGGTADTKAQGDMAHRNPAGERRITEIPYHARKKTQNKGRRKK
jgi:hypothetical protein